jgi:hypothetical protein
VAERWEELSDDDRHADDADVEVEGRISPLNDKLVADAKRLPAARNTTLSEILNEALREPLARSSASPSTRPFRMPVFRGQGSPVDSWPEELSRIGEDEALQRGTGLCSASCAV